MIMIVLYILWIVNLSASIVHGLQGDPNSICFISERQYTEIRIAPNEIQKFIDWTSITQCCPDYREIDEHCEPQCDIPCEHGKCTEPNVCVCENNYIGANCDTLICSPGYTGVDCKDRCLDNTFGTNCREKCACENGSCDPISGRCDCYDGWSGSRCSVPCAQGVSCINGGICMTTSDSTCNCPAGYNGQRCENICQQGYYGNDCADICDCEDDHFFSCDHVNGTCKSKCENGEYFEDACWCVNGWDGEFCTEKVCPDGYYGENCEKICQCQIDTTKSCDRITGECTCYPGWIGDFCEETCANMTFGERCNQSCICEDGNIEGCKPTTGECICKRGWTGSVCNRACSCVNGYCDNHGNCICDPGWQGRTCNRECNAGYFGDGCSNFCGFLKEDGNVICDRFNGPVCAAGFTGKDCMEPCPEGRYGPNCEKNCSCPSFKICNRFIGDCECLPGLYGDKCENTCRSGTFGPACSGICQCPNCNVVNGDCCQKDQHGKCEQYCSFEDFDLQNNQCFKAKRSPGRANSIFNYSIQNFTIFASILVLNVIATI